ncbi:aspartate dehydrogenase [Hyphococcus formosus]|uniref:aspartate dehydrogenase n=1 Tax=Hyphococcus formosus TaxID=3143534 RepID=UPI00398BA2AD
MKRAAIFGMGAIGTSLARDWAKQAPKGWELSAVCARPRQSAAIRDLLPSGTDVLESVEDLLQMPLDAVIETVGHASARRYGVEILSAGRDLYLLSSGILADKQLHADLIAAARQGQSRIIVPTGALAGFDGLLAMALSSEATVTYRSTKPAKAWRNTPADGEFDLDALREPLVFFRGTAREAASLYPKNANLAASVAIGGVGFEATKVELVADPAANGNLAELEVQTPNCVLKLQMGGIAERDNPKSSAIVSSSVLAALVRQESIIRLG